MREKTDSEKHSTFYIILNSMLIPFCYIWEPFGNPLGALWESFGNPAAILETIGPLLGAPFGSHGKPQGLSRNPHKTPLGQLQESLRNLLKPKCNSMGSPLGILRTTLLGYLRRFPRGSSTVPEMTPDGSRWSRWLQILPHGSRRAKMAPGAPRWLQMIPEGSRWLQMPPDGSRWMASDGLDSSRWFQIGPDGPR